MGECILRVRSRRLCTSFYCSPVVQIAAAPAEVAKGTAQPFYHVLPDMRSAAGLSRAAAESMGLMPWLTRPRYVAQSSLAAEATSGTAQDDGAFSGDHDVGLVVHPLLGRYFSCYRTDTRRFVPNKGKFRVTVHRPSSRRDLCCSFGGAVSR